MLVKLPETNQALQAILFEPPFAANYIPDILEEIYLKKVYEPYLTGKSNLTIVDVGANIGLFSFYASPFASKVYALEPSQRHYNTLSKMVQYNRLDNIIPVKIALSNKIGKEKFYHNDNKTMYSLSDVVNKKEDFEEVDTTTIDKFMKDQKLETIDFCKIDCEGSEAHIIASEGFQKVCERITVIAGEWHSWCPVDKPGFANMFADLGYMFSWNPNTRASTFTAIRL